MVNEVLVAEGYAPVHVPGLHLTPIDLTGIRMGLGVRGEWIVTFVSVIWTSKAITCDGIQSHYKGNPK